MDGPHGWRRRSPQKSGSFRFWGRASGAGPAGSFRAQYSFCRRLPPQCAARAAAAAQYGTDQSRTAPDHAFGGSSHRSPHRQNRTVPLRTGAGRRPSIRRSGRVLPPSQVEIQRVGQPIGTQGHPCAVVAVRGVDLLRAGAGAVAVMGEKVQLKRHLVGCQSRGQQHGILHRHRGIFHSVPDVEGRQSVTDLIFETHRPAQGGIVTAEVADRAVMPKFAAGDDRVAQHHGIGQSLFSADAECLPNRLSVPQDCRGRRKMAACREAADRDLGRVDMELHRVLADMQDSTGRIDQRLPAQRRLALLPTAGSAWQGGC